MAEDQICRQHASTAAKHLLLHASRTMLQSTVTLSRNKGMTRRGELENRCDRKQRAYPTYSLVPSMLCKQSAIHTLSGSFALASAYACPSGHRPCHTQGPMAVCNDAVGGFPQSTPQGVSPSPFPLMLQWGCTPAPSHRATAQEGFLDPRSGRITLTLSGAADNRGVKGAMYSPQPRFPTPPHLVKQGAYHTSSTTAGQPMGQAFPVTCGIDVSPQLA